MGAADRLGDGAHDPSKEVPRLLLESLAELKPKLVPMGRMEWLRGGVSCISLETGKGVDAAVLLSRSPYESSPASSPLFRVDYAVRGNIRGILPGRVISKVTPKMEGLLTRRIRELRWETPIGGGEVAIPLGARSGADGLPPRAAELWEGGPHQRLTELLNGDPELTQAIMSLNEGVGEPFLPSVFSDMWGESIRIGGGPWLKLKALARYTSPLYLAAVSRIGGHVKAIRRELGGISF